jgi:formylglycine-generating enzyme required for sulfatase activity
MYCASYGSCETPCQGWECEVDHGFDCGQCAEGFVCTSHRTCANPLVACGTEMTAVPGMPWCIDRWEASQGAGSVAVSAPGVQPWTSITWYDAMNACAIAGKELCPEPVWLAACAGPAGYSYPYGPEFQEGACNLWLDGTAETGEYAECEGAAQGIFDMLGNAWEWVAACVPDGCRLRGGSYEQEDEAAFVCSSRYDTYGGHGFVAGSGPQGGFRCCKAL